MSPPTFTILPVTPKDAHDIVEIAMLAFADDGLGKRFILPNSSVDAVNVLREYRVSLRRSAASISIESCTSYPFRAHHSPVTALPNYPPSRAPEAQ